MASHAEITGGDGEGQGDADHSDENDEMSIIPWLKEKRLEAFVHYFKKHAVSMEELLEFEEQDFQLYLYKDWQIYFVVFSQIGQTGTSLSRRRSRRIFYRKG